MTRADVLAAVNRHQEKIKRPPLTMRQYSRAVRIARHLGLVSERHLDEARRGATPTASAVTS